MEIASPNQFQKPIAPRLAGFLKKKGRRLRKWSSRWYVVTSRELLYFDGPPPEGKKLGSIGLRRCVVERLNREEELEDGGGLFGFRITAGGRTKRLYCDSEFERDQWVFVLESRIRKESSGFHVSWRRSVQQRPSSPDAGRSPTLVFTPAPLRLAAFRSPSRDEDSDSHRVALLLNNFLKELAVMTDLHTISEKESTNQAGVVLDAYYKAVEGKEEDALRLWSTVCARGKTCFPQRSFQHAYLGKARYLLKSTAAGPRTVIGEALNIIASAKESDASSAFCSAVLETADVFHLSLTDGTPKHRNAAEPVLRDDEDELAYRGVPVSRSLKLEVSDLESTMNKLWRLYTYTAAIYPRLTATSFLNGLKLLSDVRTRQGQSSSPTGQGKRLLFDMNVLRSKEKSSLISLVFRLDPLGLLDNCRTYFEDFQGLLDDASRSPGDTLNEAVEKLRPMYLWSLPVLMDVLAGLGPQLIVRLFKSIECSTVDDKKKQLEAVLDQYDDGSSDVKRAWRSCLSVDLIEALRMAVESVHFLTIAENAVRQLATLEVELFAQFRDGYQGVSHLDDCVKALHEIASCFYLAPNWSEKIAFCFVQHIAVQFTKHSQENKQESYRTVSDACSRIARNVSQLSQRSRGRWLNATARLSSTGVDVTTLKSALSSSEHELERVSELDGIEEVVEQLYSDGIVGNFFVLPAVRGTSIKCNSPPNINERNASPMRLEAIKRMKSVDLFNAVAQCRDGLKRMGAPVGTVSAQEEKESAETLSVVIPDAIHPSSRPGTGSTESVLHRRRQLSDGKGSGQRIMGTCSAKDWKEPRTKRVSRPPIGKARKQDGTAIAGHLRPLPRAREGHVNSDASTSHASSLGSNTSSSFKREKSQPNRMGIPIQAERKQTNYASPQNARRKIVFEGVDRIQDPLAQALQHAEEQRSFMKRGSQSISESPDKGLIMLESEMLVEKSEGYEERRHPRRKQMETIQSSNHTAALPVSLLSDGNEPTTENARDSLAQLCLLPMLQHSEETPLILSWDSNYIAEFGVQTSMELPLPSARPTVIDAASENIPVEIVSNSAVARQQEQVEGSGNVQDVNASPQALSVMRTSSTGMQTLPVSERVKDVRSSISQTVTKEARDVATDAVPPKAMEADPNPLLDIREVLLPGFKQDRDIRFSRQGMRFLAVCDYQDNFSQLISEYEGDVTDDKSPRNDNIEPELIPVPHNVISHSVAETSQEGEIKNKQSRPRADTKFMELEAAEIRQRVFSMRKRISEVEALADSVANEFAGAAKILDEVEMKRKLREGTMF